MWVGWGSTAILVLLDLSAPSVPLTGIFWGRQQGLAVDIVLVFFLLPRAVSAGVDWKRSCPWPLFVGSCRVKRFLHSYLLSTWSCWLRLSTARGKGIISTLIIPEIHFCSWQIKWCCWNPDPVPGGWGTAGFNPCKTEWRQVWGPSGSGNYIFGAGWGGIAPEPMLNLGSFQTYWADGSCN